MPGPPPIAPGCPLREGRERMRMRAGAAAADGAAALVTPGERRPGTVTCDWPALWPADVVCVSPCMPCEVRRLAPAYVISMSLLPSSGLRWPALGQSIPASDMLLGDRKTLGFADGRRVKPEKAPRLILDGGIQDWREYCCRRQPAHLTHRPRRRGLEAQSETAALVASGSSQGLAVLGRSLLVLMLVLEPDVDAGPSPWRNAG